MWQDPPGSFHRTLLDRMEYVGGQCIARMAFQERDGDHPLDLSIHQRVVKVPADIEFLQWECDHVFYPLPDYFASLLDMATDSTHQSLRRSRWISLGCRKLVFLLSRIFCADRVYCIYVCSAQFSTPRFQIPPLKSSLLYNGVCSSP